MRCNQDIRRYCRELDKRLDCPKAMKQGFLRQTKAALQRLLSEQPELAFSQAEGCLGTPEENAQAFLETLDAALLARYLIRKHVIKKLCTIAALLLVAGAICLGVWYLCKPFVQDATLIDYGTTIYRADGTVEHRMGDTPHE